LFFGGLGVSLGVERGEDKGGGEEEASHRGDCSLWVATPATYYLN
jgi:hypothetical protein